MDDRRTLLSELSIKENDREERRPVWPLALGIGMIAFLLGAGAGYLLFPQPEPATPSAPPEASVAAPAVPDSDGMTARVPILSASGYITARRMATVSAEITGRVVEVLVEEGMRVDKGQLLARLDDALARVDLELAEAQIRAAAASIEGIRANLEEARRVELRARDLRSLEFGSDAALTRAEATRQSLEADLARAEADLAVLRLQADRARERLDDHLVRAPFAGVVTDKNAQPGEIVAPGSAGGGFTRTGICTLVDMSSLEIEVDVNESFIGRVVAGQRVDARLDAYPDWAIPAHVLAIIPTANRDKATVRVRIAIDQEDPRILPDMGVNVAIYNNDS
ncbi:MAG: hypothetical protein Tsb008_10180 [Rhodothalassiaceae bacterium]